MTLASRLAAVALASLLATGTAFAQTAAPAAKTDTKTTTAAPTIPMFNIRSIRAPYVALVQTRCPAA